MIRPLVPNSKAEPVGNPVVVYNVASDHFGFLATILCEGWDVQEVIGSSQYETGALAKQLRLDSSDAGLRFTAL